MPRYELKAIGFKSPDDMCNYQLHERFRAKDDKTAAEVAAGIVARWQEKCNDGITSKQLICQSFFRGDRLVAVGRHSIDELQFI